MMGLTFKKILQGTIDHPHDLIDNLDKEEREIVRNYAQSNCSI